MCVLTKVGGDAAADEVGVDEGTSTSTSNNSHASTVDTSSTAAMDAAVAPGAAAAAAPTAVVRRQPIVDIEDENSSHGSQSSSETGTVMYWTIAFGQKGGVHFSSW